MREKKFCLILLLLCMAKPGYAQEGSDKSAFVLKWAPLNVLFDDFNTAMQFGVEKSITPKYSIQAEYGLIADWFHKNGRLPDSVGYGHTGYKLRLEGRRYFTKLNGRSPRLYKGLYVATELFYMSTQYNTKSTFRHGSLDYDDVFKVNKTVYGFNCKFGYQYRSKSTGFIFDTYVGLGLKYKHTVNEGRQYPEDNFAPAEGFALPDDRQISDKPFNGITLSIPVNFKIGYVF
jgi:hypothetical protein